MNVADKDLCVEQNRLWRPVKGYEKLYEVSSMGDVRSLGGRRGSRAKMLRQHGLRGYMRVDLCTGGKRKSYLVHRLVAEAFIANPENKPFINHIDGIPYHNYIINLEWCDHQENMNHANAIGLINNKGERHGMHKLTQSEAMYIKEHTLMTARQLSDMFMVSEAAIYDIWARRTWRSI